MILAAIPNLRDMEELKTAERSQRLRNKLVGEIFLGARVGHSKLNSRLFVVWNYSKGKIIPREKNKYPRIIQTKNQI